MIMLSCFAVVEPAAHASSVASCFAVVEPAALVLCCC